MKTSLVCLGILLGHFTAVLAAGAPDCTAGWEKDPASPILGGNCGTIFDVCVISQASGSSWMYSSWRDKKCIAWSESADGKCWSQPVMCFPPNIGSGWEDDVNRPVVLHKDGQYWMWYAGQIGAATAGGRSWIGLAISQDGRNWVRQSLQPVLSPELPWEKVAVMSPHVLWDTQAGLFKMWYCGGEQIEPSAIGYATSRDGLRWEKHTQNPVFVAEKNNLWEQDRVAGCMVLQRPGDYLMFYIGYRDLGFAQIGMARSKDGVSHWERFPQNPIIFPGNGWDADATYKPYPVADPARARWVLYYNGRRGGHEQIGVAYHPGMDLGF